MARSFDRRNSSAYNPRKLVSQFFAQRMKPELRKAMAGLVAITFRPGGYVSSFEGKTLLPAGVAKMFVLRYEFGEGMQGQHQWRIPLEAFAGQVRADGQVEYSSQTRCLHLDLACRPRAGAKGQTIDPERNPSLLDTALRMDKACQRASETGRLLPSKPLLPRVLLGFPSGHLPKFRDTPFLRQLVARQLDMPVSRLGANGELLLERLLRDTWEQSILYADNPCNRTGTALVDARLCPGERGFLRAYEDFSELLGAQVWNPARDVSIPEYANPARQVLQEVGLGDKPDYNQPISDEVIRGMLRRMRQHLAEQAGAFSDEDLLDGITEPGATLVSWGVSIPVLRLKLAVYANECCTDADLKLAVRQPHQPLWLRYACRIQTLDASGVQTFAFRGTTRTSQKRVTTALPGALSKCLPNTTVLPLAC